MNAQGGREEKIEKQKKVIKKEMTNLLNGGGQNHDNKARGKKGPGIPER